MFQPKLGFVGTEIFTNFCFLSIILATDKIESHSRALKMRIFAKFPKKLEPKEWVNGLGPRAR